MAGPLRPYPPPSGLMAVGFFPFIPCPLPPPPLLIAWQLRIFFAALRIIKIDNVLKKCDVDQNNQFIYIIPITTLVYLCIYNYLI